VANRFWKERKIELQKRLVEWQRLLWACEAAKRELTETTKTIVHVAGVARDAKGPIDLHVELTRERFEHLCDGLIKRSLAVVAKALANTGLEARDVGQVILTGGSTRIPKVRAAVADFFDRDVGTHVNPDEAVVLGAAVQGALLARSR
jgi:molecular chaperone DnaK